MTHSQIYFWKSWKTCISVSAHNDLEMGWSTNSRFEGSLQNCFISNLETVQFFLNWIRLSKEILNGKLHFSTVFSNGALHKIPWFQLISWRGSFVVRRSFHRDSGNSVRIMIGKTCASLPTLPQIFLIQQIYLLFSTVYFQSKYIYYLSSSLFHGDVRNAWSLNLKLASLLLACSTYSI